MKRVVLAAAVVVLAGCQPITDFVNKSTEHSASEVELTCNGVASNLLNDPMNGPDESPIKGVYIKKTHWLRSIEELSDACVNGYRSAESNIRLPDYTKDRLAQWKEEWLNRSSNEAKPSAFFQYLKLSAFSIGHDGYIRHHKRTLWQAIAENLGMKSG